MKVQSLQVLFFWGPTQHYANSWHLASMHWDEDKKTWSQILNSLTWLCPLDRGRDTWSAAFSPLSGWYLLALKLPQLLCTDTHTHTHSQTHTLTHTCSFSPFRHKKLSLFFIYFIEWFFKFYSAWKFSSFIHMILYNPIIIPFFPLLLSCPSPTYLSLQKLLVCFLYLSLCFFFVLFTTKPRLYFLGLQNH